MRKDEREDGFTLVEILVVIGIIVILAAIAIPIFTNQRRIANDAAVKSDVINASRAVETYFVNNPTATTFTVADVKALMVGKSEGVVLAFRGLRDNYCVWGTHPNARTYTGWSGDYIPGTRPYYLYQSIDGGTGDAVSSVSSLPCNATPVGAWS